MEFSDEGTDSGSRLDTPVLRKKAEKIINLISKARLMIDEARSIDAKTEVAENLLADANSYFSSGEFEAAKESALQTIKEAENAKRHRRVEISLSRSETAMSDAMKSGVDGAEIRQLIGKARESLELGLVAQAAEYVRDARRAIVEEKRKHFINLMISRVSDTAIELQHKGSNVEEVMGTLGEARLSIERAEYGRSRTLISRARKLLKQVEKHRKVETIVLALEEEIEETKRLGIDVARVNELLQKAKMYLETKNHERIKKSVKKARRILRWERKQRENEILIETIGSLIERAGKGGADLLSARKLLNDMSRAIRDGTIADLSKMELIESSLDVRRYTESAANLKQLIEKASGLQIDTIHAREVLSRTEEMISGGEDSPLEALIEETSRTAESLRQSLIKASTEMIERTEERVAKVKKINLDVSSTEKILLEAREFLGLEEFSKVLANVRIAEGIVDGLLSDYSEQKEMEVEMASSILRELSRIGTDSSKVDELVEKARDRPEDPTSLGIQVQGILQSLDDALRSISADLLSKAKERIDHSLRLHLEVHGSDKALRNAEDAFRSGRYVEAMKLSLAVYNVVESHLNENISERCENEIELLKEKLEVATSLGLDVEEARELLKRAEDAFKNNEFEAVMVTISGALELIQRKTIDLSLARAKEGLDSLKSEVAVVSGSKTDEIKIGEVIASSEQAVSEGEHEKAMVLATEAGTMVDSARRTHLWRSIATRTEAIAQAIEELNGVGIDMANAGSTISSLKDEVTPGTDEQHLKKLMADINLLDDEVDIKIRKFLDTVNHGLDTARRMEVEVGVHEAQKLVDESEDYLSRKGYAHCINLAKQAKDIIEDSMLQRHTEIVKGKLEILKSLLRDANEHKIDVSSTESILHEVEKRLEVCNLLKHEDREGIHEILERAQRMAKDAIELELKAKGPKLTTEMLPFGIQAGVWNRCLLEIANNGDLAATNIDISVNGDLDVKGLKLIDEIKPLEKRIQEIGIMPNRDGELPMNLTLSYHRVFDDSRYVDRSEMNVDVATAGTYNVEDVFLIHNDGRLISHVTRKCEDEMDEDIFSGMLTAMREFIKDSFKKGGNVGLRRLAFSEKNVLIEPGRDIFLSVIVSGGEPALLPIYMIEVIIEIQKEYGDVLKNWSGLLDEVEGIEEHLKGLLVVTDSKDEDPKELQKSFVTSTLRTLEEAARSGLDISEDERFIEDLRELVKVEDFEAIWRHTEAAGEKLQRKLKERVPSKYVATLSAEDLKDYEGLILDDEQLKENLSMIKTIVESIMRAKDKEGFSYQWPMKRIALKPSSQDIMDTVKKFESVIKNYTNVKEIEVILANEVWEGLNVELIPNEKAIKRFQEWSKVIALLSKSKSPLNIKKKIDEGNYSIGIGGQQVKITPEMIDVRISIPANVKEFEFDWGKMYLDMEQDDDLKGEGFADALIEKINSVKKSQKLGERLEKLIIGTRAEIAKLLAPFEAMIGSKTSAKSIRITDFKAYGKWESTRFKIRDEYFSVHLR